MIAAVAVDADEVLAETAHRGCSDCPGGDRCKRPEVRETLGMKWPACPFALMNEPHWQIVVSLRNAGEVSPLAGWGSQWAAWVERGVVAIEHALGQKRAAYLEGLRAGGDDPVSMSEFMEGF